MKSRTLLIILSLITCHILSAKSVIYKNLSELPDSLREQTISESLKPFSIYILNKHWGGEIKFTRDDDRLSYKTYESSGDIITYYDIPHKVVLDVRNWDTGKEYKKEITRKNVRMMPGEAYYDFQVREPTISLVTDSKIVFTLIIVKLDTDEGDCLEVTVSNDGVQIKNMDIVPGEDD